MRNVKRKMAADDNVVVHRAKECCVRMHSCVQKWQQLSSQGMDVASKLVQSLMQKKYTETESSLGVLQGDGALSSSLQGKLMIEQQTLYSQLVEVKDKMVKVVEEMGRMSNNVSSSVELLLMQGQECDQPLCNTLPPSTYSETFANIFQAYSEDTSAKESIVGDITRQKDRDILTVYLMCWLHQPYITAQCTDLLEALLLDCGLRT